MNAMKQADVSTRPARVEELESQRKLVRTLMGGTMAMRAAGNEYLPKHPAEGPEVYKTRLSKTFLDNFLELAVNKAVGKIFSKSVKLENVPLPIEELCADIDRQQRDLDSFMMDVAGTAFTDGISYVLVDKPPVAEGATLAQEKAAGVRPYAVHLKPCCIIEPRHEMIDGVDTITLLRWHECAVESDGEWGRKEIPQIRVLRRVAGEGVKPVVRWETYRQLERKEWMMYEEGPTAFTRIHFHAFYTNRVGFLEGAPGFQNIAESTLEHWQVKSEFSHALSMQCFGMLTATGVEDSDQIQVGPGKVLKSTNPDANFSYTEPTGAGIKLAAEALKAIESRIETCGVNLRVENQGKVTATAAAIDSADTHAGLAAIAEGFGDSMEQVFASFAEMLGIDAPKEMDADFNKDFALNNGTQAGLVELTKLRGAGDISREAILGEFKRRDELDPEYDAIADAALIAKEPRPADKTAANL